MNARRFSVPALLTAILMAFAVPGWANHFGTLTGSVVCSSYTLQFQVDDETGVSHTITYSFTLHPASGPDIPISGSTTFPTVGQGANVTITVTGSFSPAANQIHTIENSAATLITDGTPEQQNFPISFTSSTVGPCPSFGGCTVTQGGWGAPPHGNNPGAFLKAHFAGAFPSGVTIGGSPFSLLFTSASAIQNFLPQGGPPSALNASATNPTSRTSAGVFAGQVLALELNVSLYSVGSLVLTGTGTSLDGSTVSAILAAANQALAGGTLPTGFTSISQLNDLIDELNSSFDGCHADGFANNHLQ